MFLISSLDALRIVDAGQLDDDAVAADALARDHRLGDAEVVDAVADRLHRLVDRQVADLGVVLGAVIVKTQRLSPLPASTVPARQVARRRRSSTSVSRASGGDAGELERGVAECGGG